uniref:Immunoglobulin domain-containing protein n=1 Tax=Cyprinus carpio TaxID=7962 RepID=A0A8C2CDK6_CYPCA
VMEGDLVTLNTSVTKQQHDTVRWYFNDILIALINGHPNTSCLYDGEDGRFRKRLEVDYETGSLIITNITTEHAGRYEAEIIRSESSGKSESLNRTSKCNSTKIIHKSSIFVSVFGDTHVVKSVSAIEGNTVNLSIDVSKQYHEPMLWYFNCTRIALINEHRNKSCLYDGPEGIFRNRLKVDTETGSLTITDITTEHAGRYEAEIIKSQSPGKSESLSRNPKCDSTKINKKNIISEDITISFNLTVSGEPVYCLFLEYLRKKYELKKVLH